MSAPKTKYEFGRHETFHLREGWLSKGLDKLVADGGFKVDVDTADTLGLGKNMVKSLAYWLEASGLGTRATEDGSKTAGPLAASSFGSLLLSTDPHFEYAVSTWLVHLVLARRAGSVWNFFFNDFRSGVFDRETCLEAFQRHVRDHSQNQTTLATLQKEVNALLATYAALPPSQPVDPEDVTISPLRSLSLLVKHPDTGRFEKTTPLDAVPLEAFLASVQLLTADADTETLPLSDLISRRNSPARLFNIDGDAINELAHQAAEIHGSRGVALSLLGSTRTITMPAMTAEDWYGLHFKRIGG